MRKIGVVTSKGLSLRARPSARAFLLDELSKGDELDLLEMTVGKWVLVQVLKTKTGIGVGANGWVNSDFVRVTYRQPDVPPPLPKLPEPDHWWPYNLWAAVIIVAGLIATWFWSSWATIKALF